MGPSNGASLRAISKLEWAASLPQPSRETLDHHDYRGDLLVKVVETAFSPLSTFSPPLQTMAVRWGEREPNRARKVKNIRGWWWVALWPNGLVFCMV